MCFEKDLYTNMFIFPVSNSKRVRPMHEMNVLVTVAVIAGLYIALFYVAEKVFMRDSE